MAVYLDYQMVYARRRPFALSVRTQLIAALVLLVVLAAKVWIKLESTDLGYQLAKERQKTVELDMTRRELDLERSVLLRADNLSRVAEKRLGLVPLHPRQARKIRS